MTTVGVATVVALPLGAATVATPVASAVTAPATTSVSTVVAPTSAQVAAAYAKRLAAHRAAVKRAKARAKAKAAAKKRARLVARGKKVVRIAARYKGRPYVYGAAGPRAFDCSGFTSYVVRKALHVSLPHNAAAQRHNRHVKRIKKSNRRIGDLIFFGGGGGISHVGIYAGHGLMWDSPHSGSHVHKHRIHGGVVGYGRIR